MTESINWPKVADEIGPKLLRYFGASFPMALAEDLVQETLLRLFKGVSQGKFDPLRGNLRMWAYGIAHNVRYEARRIIPFEPFADTHSPIQDAEQPMKLALRQAIEKLAEPQKGIILLLLDQDLTLNEISLILEIPLNTIKSHVHRAKENLKSLLSDTKEELYV